MGGRQLALDPPTEAATTGVRTDAHAGDTIQDTGCEKS